MGIEKGPPKFIIECIYKEEKRAIIEDIERQGRENGMETILIAEDDRALNEGIRLSLREKDRLFIQCHTVRETLRRLNGDRVDLMILDINFPDGSGLDVLKEVRSRGILMKVILLTANNMETDIVTGLELGADDYITKPFSLMVLRARVNVQLRTRPGDGNGSYFAGEDFRFDFERMSFQVRGDAVELGKTEQKVLRVLVENRGRTVTREQLIDRVWDGDAEYVDGHALTVTVKRLRDKLGEGAENGGHIRTVYGIGYVFE